MNRNDLIAKVKELERRLDAQQEQLSAQRRLLQRYNEESNALEMWLEQRCDRLEDNAGLERFDDDELTEQLDRIASGESRIRWSMRKKKSSVRQQELFA